jgi:uridine phosphorylase
VKIPRPTRPFHLTCAKGDFDGNGGRGRYVFLPGSPERAERIASAFVQGSVRRSPRAHDVHLGQLSRGSDRVDVAAVSSGMGPGSLEIIVSELLACGAKCFLRVGSAGSLQDRIAPPAQVVATGAVRDEAVSDHYLPEGVPAVPSRELTSALVQASRELGHETSTFAGLVHSKSSLYAREFGAGPRGEEHLRYMEELSRIGVLATEMEAATLFSIVQSRSASVATACEAACIVGILDPSHSADTIEAGERSIEMAIETALRAVWIDADSVRGLRAEAGREPVR